jgi:hypothetical protein
MRPEARQDFEVASRIIRARRLDQRRNLLAEVIDKGRGVGRRDVASLPHGRRDVGPTSAKRGIASKKASTRDLKFFSTWYQRTRPA